MNKARLKVLFQPSLFQNSVGGMPRKDFIVHRKAQARRRPPDLMVPTTLAVEVTTCVFQ